ncbi:hypothetical protein [Oerskovia jenensis]|uniref:hypothetical protein n=1 Tax=Oerskovia jenensis TaxID=162169 RepID=UPI0036DA57AD
MADWVGIVVASAALVVSFLVWLDGRKNARESTADAKEAVRVANRAAESAARSADALEVQAARFEPKWSVERSPMTGTNLLTNLNGEPALDVEVVLDHPWYFLDPDDEEPSAPTKRFSKIGAGSSEVFLFLAEDAPGVTGNLVVTWQRPSSTSAARERWSVPVRWLIS